MVAAQENKLQAIVYKRKSLKILDQRALPHKTLYVDVADANGGFEAVHSMTVRGAPALAIVAILSLAVELANGDFDGLKDETRDYIFSRLDYLVGARPTAVNLKDAVDKMKLLLKDNKADVVETYIKEAEKMLEHDVEDNMAIGRFGQEYLASIVDSKEPWSILTHCNTGSLATAGYGTALGIIRSLYAKNLLNHVYFTFTAPYNQGSRLTAYELNHDGIPSTLITDSMASACIRLKNVKAIVVGADRVVRNGDTANKIGTYQLAISAKYHKIPFIVAAPTTSIDIVTKTGEEITIEERKQEEMKWIKGPLLNSTLQEIGIVDVVSPGTNCWNPAFDVTPAALITAIITEKGVVMKETGKDYYDLSASKV
jgi:methylthioribose-1-phosphate isomerase